MSRLWGAVLALAGALAGMAFCCWCVLTSPAPPADAVGRPSRLVLEEPARGVPLYTQLDERWGGLPYAEGTVSTSGCGLVCAAMAWEWLSGETCTPPMLLNLVGNDCVQEGQNYMPGFCEWMVQQDPTLDYTVLYESRERALEESEGGRMVFACMEGALYEGGREYGGHVVLITGVEGNRVEIHDPMTVYEVSLTREEFNGVAWAYFISIGRG